jgi:hypothetical protein
MVVMTPNVTLSIPNALKSERPDDYYETDSSRERADRSSLAILKDE